MEKRKRERHANFSREETEVLINLVEKKLKVIENKQSDSITWQEKEQAWKDIEMKFNSKVGGIFRDYKHLKMKYDGIKRDTRKKAALERAERYKTGGGVNCSQPLTPVEEKVRQMILLSVNGEESIFDSDCITTEMTNSASIYVGHDGAVSITGNPKLLLPKDKKEMTLEIPSIQTIEYLSDSPPNERNLQTTEDPVEEIESPIEVCLETGKWKDWNPKSLKTKKSPALQSKLKEKRPFEKLAESKMEIVNLQKQLIEEDIAYRRELHELEKNNLLMKIEVTKMQLENEKRKVFGHNNFAA